MLGVAHTQSSASRLKLTVLSDLFFGGGGIFFLICSIEEKNKLSLMNIRVSAVCLFILLPYFLLPYFYLQKRKKHSSGTKIKDNLLGSVPGGWGHAFTSKLLILVAEVAWNMNKVTGLVLKGCKHLQFIESELKQVPQSHPADECKCREWKKQSQDGWCWKGPLEVILSKPLLGQGHL